MTMHSNIWVHGGHSYWYHHTGITNCIIPLTFLVPKTKTWDCQKDPWMLCCAHTGLLLFFLSFLNPTIHTLSTPPLQQEPLFSRSEVLKSASSGFLIIWSFLTDFCFRSWQLSQKILKIEYFKHNISTGSLLYVCTLWVMYISTKLWLKITFSLRISGILALLPKNQSQSDPSVQASFFLASQYLVLIST